MGEATDEEAKGRAPPLEPTRTDGAGSTVLIVGLGGDWFHTALSSRRLDDAPEPSCTGYAGGRGAAARRRGRRREGWREQVVVVRSEDGDGHLSAVS